MARGEELTQKQGCLGFLFGNKAVETDEELPYRIRDDFLSNAEFSFYKILTQIFGERYVVCPKVSLGDIFYVTNPHKNQSYRNKIDRKHVDFLICEKSMMKPLIGIELDDSSHDRQKRQERDLFVDEVFKVAMLPLARVKSQTSYNVDDLKKYLSSVYQSTKTQSSTVNVEDGDTDIKIETEDNTPTKESKNKTTTTSSTMPPECPKCGISLIIRKSRNGDIFYGCTNYPKCKITVDI